VFLEGTLPVDIKIARVNAFLTTLKRDLPVVLKPDQGQRGSGVVVARTREALDASLARTNVDTIVQEYVSGV
jgi:glutathione synthase/RimK-type ligase-like ATP-grasp enzyme